MEEVSDPTDQRTDKDILFTIVVFQYVCEEYIEKEYPKIPFHFTYKRTTLFAVKPLFLNILFQCETKT